MNKNIILGLAVIILLIAGVYGISRMNSRDIGPASNLAQVAADTIAPTVSLTSASNGATISGTATINAAATDNVAVAGVWFQIDGINYRDRDNYAPYSKSFDSTTFADGSHTLSAIAVDTSGNNSVASTVNITIKNSTAAAPAPSTPTPVPTPVSSTPAPSPV